MAGWINAGEIQAAGDITTGANINRPQSHSQRAVDDRIRALGPELAGMDPDVQAAAIAALDAAIAGKNLLERNRGVIPAGASLNSYQTGALVGTWRLRNTRTYPVEGAPIVDDGVFILWRGDNDWNSAVQMIFTAAGFYWRKAFSQGNWSKWQYIGEPSERPLLQRARRDGWTALYDPSNLETVSVNALGNVTEIRDSLGNFPPLVVDGAVAPPYLRAEFGELAGIGMGQLAVTFPEVMPQPLTVMAVAGDDVYRGFQRGFLGSDGDSNRLQMGVSASETAYVGNAYLTRGNLGIQPGPHIWETRLEETNTILNIDGQLFHRGLPAGANQQEGLASLRLGGGRRTSPTSVSFPWQGTIGPVVIRDSIDERASNRMRQTLRTLTGIQDMPPQFAPTVRAYDIDSRGRETVVWGDPDIVMTTSVASITKVLNAVVARSILDTEAKLNETVEVIASDEFLPNPPHLAAGDVVSYRDLLASMLIPSNNTAPRTVARTLGVQLPGSGDPTVKYLRAMQAQLDAWGFYGASIRSNPGGGLRISMRHTAQMMLNAVQDPLLMTLMSSISHTVTITGPNARSVVIENTFISGNVYGRWREWIASKDGTGIYTAGSVFMWRHFDGTIHVGVIQGSVLNVNSKNLEVAKLMEAVKSGRLIDNRFVPVRAFEYEGGPIPHTWGLQPVTGGNIPDNITSLDEMYRDEHLADWRGFGRTIGGLPADLPDDTAWVLEVRSGSSSESATLQRITMHTGVWTREMRIGGSLEWGDWMRLETA